MLYIMLVVIIILLFCIYKKLKLAISILIDVASNIFETEEVEEEEYINMN
jgi:glucan phosphoethanolaminetransferase (alkaline phosphatase superfamily)